MNDVPLTHILFVSTALFFYWHVWFVHQKKHDYDVDVDRAYTE